MGHDAPYLSAAHAAYHLACRDRERGARCDTYLVSERIWSPRVHRKPYRVTGEPSTSKKLNVQFNSMLIDVKLMVNQDLITKLPLYPVNTPDPFAGLCVGCRFRRGFF